jgi:hypothetical protein
MVWLCSGDRWNGTVKHGEGELLEWVVAGKGCLMMNEAWCSHGLRTVVVRRAEQTQQIAAMVVL